jgi:hypothetical protein
MYFLAVAGGAGLIRFMGKRFSIASLSEMSDRGILEISFVSMTILSYAIIKSLEIERKVRGKEKDDH